MNKFEILKKNKNLYYFTNIFLYSQFSSIAFLIKLMNQETYSTGNILFIIGSLISNKMPLKNYYALIFVETTERLFKFIQFFSRLTDKIKIIYHFKNSFSKMKKNCLHLVSKNESNFSKIFSKLTNMTNSKIFFIPPEKKVFDEFYFLIGNMNQKTFVLSGNLVQKKKNSLFFNFYKKQLNLCLDFRLTPVLKQSCVNSAEIICTKHFDFFLKFLFSSITTNNFKIILIVDEFFVLKYFSLQFKEKMCFIISKMSSINQILRNLKNFNSRKNGCLAIQFDCWKKNNLFN